MRGCTPGSSCCRWTSEPAGGGRPVGKPVVEEHGVADRVGDAGGGVCRAGFDRLGDNAFKALVLARIIEPTSKADTVRVLAELGVPGPTRVTYMRCLKRVIERDYRGVIATACYAHATRDGGLALVLYDLTTLHFETDVEDRLRKVGMSKERRVDPQVTVGLLTTASGFPLEVHLFEGNKAETNDPDPGPDRVRRTPPRARPGRGRRRRDAVRGEPARPGAGRVLASSSAPRPPAPPTISPTTSAGTGTRSPTARSSRPPAAWAPASTPGSGGSSTSTCSNGPSTTAGRSTR